MSQKYGRIVALGVLSALFAGSVAVFGQSITAASGFTPLDCSNPANSSNSACGGVSSVPGAANLTGMNVPLPNNMTGSDLNGRSARHVPTYIDRDAIGRQGDNSSIVSSPPPKPTQFQRMVQGAIGKMLPIFGASLFSGVPATFAPIQHVPITADYVIGSGDEIAVRVWGGVNFNLRATVDRAGSIYVPQVGQVHVAGLRFSQLDGYLRSQFRPVFRNFDLSANMGRLRSIQIFVVGNARRPGSYTISSLSTLVNAIFATGGPSPHGSMRRIQVLRDDKVVTTFDLYDLLLQGHTSKNIPLLSGDVVYIPPVGPLVAVAGSVNVPAIYELKGHETVEDAIQLAGGESTMAGRRGAQLERTSSAGTRFTVDLSLDATGPATSLRDGDILRIPSIVLRFDKTVTLRGNVANPGRYAWRPGMRIQDLIPDKRSLETRDYWRHRIALGLPAPEYTPLTSAAPSLSKNATTPIAGAPQSSVAERQTAANDEIVHTLPAIDWQYAVVERMNPDDLTTSLVSFDLGQAIANSRSSQNLALHPNDVVTIFSTSDIEVPQNQRTKYVHLQGEFVHAGVYSARPGETLRELIARAGGLTPQAYLYGSQFLRVSTQRQQQARLDQYLNQLQREVQESSSNKSTSTVHPEAVAAQASSGQSQMRMIASMRQMQPSGRIVLKFTPYSKGDMSVPDMPLEDGDRFIVPAVPSTVNVLGAVYNQDSYQYGRGERVGDYLKEAGGATRDADKRHEFVIRANGSVLSKQYARGTVFTGGLNDRYMYPGDSVVVPTAINKTTLLRGLSDWSSVFSQFGLGIAALTLLGF